ncbi:MAG TPA: DUF1007 family protein [Pseudolabrys sp.]|jgi:ABC-type uncharacterized transport system substrate-binding protein|nr:DUF1007 family protein [Pseudolabrys sp.]
MTASLRIFLAAFLTSAFAGIACAHPHVWVTMHTELVYAPDGKITGIRQAWSFDDMFSTFATQGLESKEKGRFTREELAPLAKVNIESLKEYDYFTYATADGAKAELAEPAPGYWLDYADQVLTLNFTLPFKKPLKAKELRIEIYDPTIFVDFSFAKEKPAQLVGAPKCKLDVVLPREMTFAEGKRLSEIPADQKNTTMAWGAQFAHKLLVHCP